MTTVLRASGLLRVFADAGVLSVADVHVARRLGALGGEGSEPVLLAAALAVRAVRLGAVCVELPRMHEVSVEDVDVTALPWPAVEEVVTALRRSPLVTGGVSGSLTPLRLLDSDAGELLYLDRYFRQEQTIRDALDDRAMTAPPYDAALLAAGLAERFGAAPDRQRVAAALAVTRWTAVVAGGPGTGKTYTVARILQLLQAQSPGLRIALAAPTGKAAARLQEQVNAQGVKVGGVDVSAVTLHRLLGWRPDSATRFRHDGGNRLPHDVVVVDETSMVSLTMMARLLEAVRPDARLVLVGDPDQLASVDAGAVLGDLVARPVRVTRDPALEQLLAPDLAAADDPLETALSPDEVRRLGNGVVRLSRGRRYGGAIADLAVAVRAGDEQAVLEVLHRGDPAVELVAPTDLAAVRADVVASSRTVTRAALAGDVDAALAGLEAHRLLCAHRTGPAGVTEWDRTARDWLGEPLAAGFRPGQPLLVTANDNEAKVYNGDTGVVVQRTDGSLVAAFARVGEPVLRHPASLAAVETVYAMTIHRSQGSQYHAVSIVLPPEESVLLTRELLYTAVTRAQAHVRLIGTQASVLAGVRRQVLRASGLRRVLQPPA